MEISKAVMMSVVLLSLSAGVMIPPLFQVYVTNFPLDEQGNLKVRIMNEKDLQAYKDSVQVTLLDWSGLPSDQSEYRNDGLYLDGFHPIELPFAFSSKQTFKNVSGLILAFTVYPISHDTKFGITFNGNVTITASIKPHDLVELTYTH